jgi:SAM-dependent methyltransferase
MDTAAKANRSYFHEAYRTGEHGWDIGDPSPFALKFLKSVRKEVPVANYLDIGCGEGRHCIAAVRLGFKATGVDYEPLALKRAARFAHTNGARGIRFRRADVLALPFRPASFDVVLDYGCLHHQKKSNWEAYRKTILKVLKPGGFYILSVFAPEFRLFRTTRKPWHIAFGAYRRCFTNQDIVSLFQGDFDILQLELEENGEFWHAMMKRRAGE